MKYPEQPSDYVRPSERTSPRPADDLPPTWLGYLILGLFVGFLLGAAVALSYGL